LDGRDEGDRPPPGAAAAFQYWSAPAGDKADPRDPWFRLEVESVRGMLDTRLLHTLRLLPPGGRGAAPGWRLATALEAGPVRAGVEALEAEWPAPGQSAGERGPRRLSAVASTKEDPSGRRTRFQLASESLKPFRLELEAQPGEAARGEPFAAAAGSPHPSA